MEYQKITNLLSNLPDKMPRFITKIWIEEKMDKIWITTKKDLKHQC